MYEIMEKYTSEYTIKSSLSRPSSSRSIKETSINSMDENLKSLQIERPSSSSMSANKFDSKNVN